MKKVKDVEAIYPLSPMQRGLLYHSLYTDGSELYIRQLSSTTWRGIDVDALRRAWQEVIARHPVLRSAFVWEGVEQPLQVVFRHVDSSWTELDWTSHDAQEQQRMLAEFRAADWRQGFQLLKAPLMRLTVIRLADDRYQIIWTLHHLILDGWSKVLVLRDLLTLYEAFGEGREPRLPTSRPYRDYVAWLNQQDQATAEAYWRKTLAGFTSATPFVPERRALDSPAADKVYKTQKLCIPASGTAALKALSRRHLLTPNTIVQGLWAVLLARYSGEDDVVFGCVVSGRPPELEGIENMVGVFINTLPMRARIDARAPLLDWLREFQDQQVEMRRFELSALEDIQRWSEVPAGDPLFETIYVFENYPTQDTEQKDELIATEELTSMERTNFPLTLAVRSEETLDLHISHDLSVFDVTAVRRLLSQLEVLLEGVCLGPRTPLGELPLVRRTERHQQLVEWNATSSAMSFPERCLDQLFSEQVARTPDALALVSGDQQLTYGELDRRAQRLGESLQALGVGPETVVGLCLRRSLEMVTALLATHKAGGIYLPLDPDLPRERLEHMVTDARPRVILNHVGEEWTWPGAEFQAVPVDTTGAPTVPIATAQTAPKHRGSRPENAAYVIYTSGSTGAPKGVLVSHRAICNRLLWGQATQPFTPSTRFLQMTPTSFDVSVWELTGPFTGGSTLILPPVNISRDPKGLVDLMASHRVTDVHFVPTLLDLFLREPQNERVNSLQRVFCGGESLPDKLVHRLRELWQAKLYNYYGPSETTINVTVWDCPPGTIRPVSIGRPIAGASVYLLDAHLRPTPSGVGGEIYIAGTGLARGYFDRRLTAGRFLPDPFSEEPGARLYKTGDRGRYLNDGAIDFLGRVDHQVKIYGVRIELGEIEAALREHPRIEQAAVVLWIDRTGESIPGDKRLVAWVKWEASPGEEVPGPGELRRFLEQKLPDSMIPGYFGTLEALPLTTSGKIDRTSLARRALPDQERTSEGQLDTHNAPRTPVEEILAGIWSEVLRAQKIGRHDNFFELGGDSILNLQVVSRARKQGVHITPQQIFEHPTLAEISPLLEAPPAPQEATKATEGPVPLTPIQVRFFEQKTSRFHHGNQDLLLEVPADINPRFLAQALRYLVEAHDALRMHFRVREGTWRQILERSGEAATFLHIDLAAIPPQQQAARVTAAAQTLQESLDLDRGPVSRMAWLDLGEGRPARLLWIIHHLVVDGVSWRILLNDLQTVVEQLAAGKPPELPASTTSFKEWAEGLTKYSAGKEVEAELDHWLSVPSREEPSLAPDFPAGANLVGSVESVATSLTATETRDLLKRVPRAYRTQINDVLLAALAMALKELGTNPIVIDMEGHGREEVVPDSDLSRTVGWFTTRFPLAFAWEDGAAPEDVLKSVKETLRNVPVQGIGYGVLRYLHPDAEVRRKVADHGQSDISFNYLGQLDRVLESAPIFRQAPEPTGFQRSPEEERPHRINILARVEDDRLQVRWSFSIDLYRPRTLEVLAEKFTAHLRALIAHCLEPGAGGYTPSDFPLANIDQATLDSVTQSEQQVEDIYPLSATQKGMLFHTLAEPDSATYFQQLSCLLEGPLDAVAFRRAWQRVVDRHPVLRTSVIWQDLNQLYQIVRQGVELDWREEDWRDLPGDQQEEQLRAWLEQDRVRGFELSAPSLFRLALFRLGDTTYRLIWSTHHMLLDGWCNSLIFNEILSFYRAFREDRELELEVPRPYRHYIAWLLQQDLEEAETFWRETLAGFRKPTSLAPMRRPVPADLPPGNEKPRIRLSKSSTAALTALARRYHLTLNTLLQGAWALLLSRYTEEQEVLYGTTVSGRPVDLEGVEQMIGNFLKTLPSRISVDPQARLMDWLKALQEQQVACRKYEYAPLNKIQSWSELPPGTRLFDSLFVFENYPVDESLQQRQPGFEMTEVKAWRRTNYPLTIVAGPGDELWLQAIYDPRDFEDAVVLRILDHLRLLLEEFPERSQDPLAEIPLLSPGELEEIRARRDGDSSGAGTPTRVEQASWEEPYVAPRNATEEQLAEIWQEVLGIETVGIHDNFFMLGGDSILFIQVMARINQAGLRVASKSPYSHQTVAELASFVVSREEQGEEDTGEVIGDVALTPIQRWFFEQDLPDHAHFNQALMLEAREPLDPSLCREALARVLEQHDALRFHFLQEETGWRQFCADEETVVPFELVDLKPLEVEHHATTIEETARRLQKSLDLEHGPLVRLALLDLGPAQPSRLLFIIHHLVVDAVSWRILLEDFQSAYRQLEDGGSVVLPPKTASYQSWARHLVEYAQSPELAAELDYWLSTRREPAPPLPIDHPDGSNTIRSFDRVAVSLSREETAFLLQKVPAVYRTQINDVLLTALALTFRQWTGQNTLSIHLEGHGREELFGNLDLSRTVGWFTSIFPVQLDLEGVSEPAEVLKSVKEQLRRLPNRGVGYGILRYLGPSSSGVESLRRMPHAQVQFNYLGQWDHVLPSTSPFSIARESTGPGQDPGGLRPHLLDIHAHVLEDRLEVLWAYSTNLFRPATLEKLAHLFARSLRDILEHCRSPEAGGATPSDFPLANLDQATLDQWIGGARDVEDLYPLSPMQQGMLFHLLTNPGRDDYFEQLTCEIAGELDGTAFLQAWQTVTDRHPILRTGFLWQGLDEPLQIVRTKAELPIARLDWRHLSADQVETELSNLLTSDRARGFDFSNPPLMRLTLVELEGGTSRFLWSFHHMLIDGWSLALALKEVFDLYETASGDQPPSLKSPIQPFRNYISWLKQQDPARAEQFWAEALSGTTQAADLVHDQPIEEDFDPENRTGVERFRFSEPSTAQIHAFARQHRVSLNILIQGALALVLSRFGNLRDVVFGSVVSGRPADLEGVEDIVGLFINTLPVRIGVPDEAPLIEWLRGIQDRQLQMMEYQHHPLAELQRFSGRQGESLFEVIYTFENYPVDDAIPESISTLDLRDIRFFGAVDFPLSITALPGDRLGLTITYDRRRYHGTSIIRLQHHVETLLNEILAAPQAHLGALQFLGPNERHQLLYEWNDTADFASDTKSLHNLFELRAARDPQAPAVVCDEEEISFGELDARADRLARHLGQRGVGPEIIVGICMLPSPHMLLAILAVLKAGGTFLPMDPTYPEERLRFMLDDSGAILTLTGSPSPQALTGRTVLSLDDEALTNPPPPTLSPPDLHPESAACLIYTSGSTGRPKGAVMTHHALVRYTSAMTRHFALKPGDRVLQFASPGFDVVLEELFPTWSSGAAVALTKSGAQVPPSNFSKLLERLAVTAVQLPAPYWHEWVDHLVSSDSRPPGCLQQLILGAEKPLPDRLEAWDAFGIPVLNVFGLTETTITSTVHAVPEATTLRGPRTELPIGRPVAETRIYLVDQELAPAPIGCLAQMVISGSGPARGYRHRARQTAERFIPDPFSDRPGERLYVTGDLARYRSNGDLEFHGRIDHQVKIRGFRIELGEIEAALRDHPAIRNAVVIPRNDLSATPSRDLVAYFLPTGPTAPSSASLRDELRKKLPLYMVPSAFFGLKEFPLTVHGKIDRRALPRPERQGLEETFVAPRGETEAKLAEIWSEVLGVETVGVNDEFFDLGGHSLKAMQLIARVRRAFDVEIPLQVVYDHLTIATMAVTIVEHEAAQMDSDELLELLKEVEQAAETKP